MSIENPSLDAIRDPDGKLPAYAWPGGINVIYYTTDGDAVCAECANQDQSEYDDPVTQWDLFYEGPPEQCANCYKMIESAYGDPDEDNDSE